MLGKKATQKTPKEVPELLTLSEACELLRVHPNTLRNWDAKGLLPAIRIGVKRVRRYDKNDLIKYLKKK